MQSQPYQALSSVLSALAAASSTPTLSHLCDTHGPQNVPFRSLSLLRRAKLPVTASQASPTPLPASSRQRQRQALPPRAGRHRVPRDTSIQRKDTKEKRQRQESFSCWDPAVWLRARQESRICFAAPEHSQSSRRVSSTV